MRKTVARVAIRKKVIKNQSRRNESIYVNKPAKLKIDGKRNLYATRWGKSKSKKLAYAL